MRRQETQSEGKGGKGRKIVRRKEEEEGGKERRRREEKNSRRIYYRKKEKEVSWNADSACTHFSLIANAIYNTL